MQKNLRHNGKFDGKRRNPLISGYLDCFAALAMTRISILDDEAIRLVSGCLDCFASLAGDKREHPSIPYTLTPPPYRWCAHVSAIKINNLQGQKRDMSAMTEISNLSEYDEPFGQ
jgi:hypothetical protein